MFDIARGGTEDSDACDDPFVAQLWVENEESERARVTEAKVRLTTLDGQTLRFDQAAGGDALESSSFTVPISICDGCRTLCASDPEAEGATCSAPELGPLRTFCVDPQC